VKKAPPWGTLEKTNFFQDSQEVLSRSKNVMKKEIPPAPDREEEMMAEAVGRDLLISLAPRLVRLEAG
jgi:hypothetical protein